MTPLGCELLGHWWAPPHLAKNGDGKLDWYQRCVRCHEERAMDPFLVTDSEWGREWAEGIALQEAREWARRLAVERAERSSVD